MYTNITLAGPDLSAVEELLRRAGRTAYVLVRPGFWVVYDKASEQQDGTVEGLARQIAAGIGCSALAVTNHDDDVLIYRLFVGARETDSYNSRPGYWDWNGEGVEPGPAGGDSAALCAAFDRDGSQGSVDAVLTGAFDFEVERHAALCRALGLSGQAAGVGFTDVSEGHVRLEQAGARLLVIGVAPCKPCSSQ
jgi:hypothetical protein